MNEDIIKRKIQKAIELICHLYKDDIIVTAYIVGSVAKGTARKDSDIDIYLIHPSFEETRELEPESVESITESPYLDEEERRKLLETWIANINLSHKLEEMGAEFKILSLADIDFWYQIYNGEAFHIMTASDIDIVSLEEPHIEVTKDLCDQ